MVAPMFDSMASKYDKQAQFARVDVDAVQVGAGGGPGV